MKSTSGSGEHSDSGTEGQARRAPGRPRGNRRQTLLDHLKEFRESNQDEKYFTTQNFRRQLEGAVANFSALVMPAHAMKEEADKCIEAGGPPPELYEDTDEMQALRKQGQEAVSISKAWAKNGQFDKEFARIYSM
eukprot:9066494-Pyramimonas_sp.AAC.1